MKAQHWVVSVRYAAPGSRPGNRRHPAPEDFRRQTVVGPVGAFTVGAVLDLLEVPESVRLMIRAQSVVRDFVDGRLVPNPPYPQHASGGHYVSISAGEQFVEWAIEFMFVTQLFVQQETGDLA